MQPSLLLVFILFAFSLDECLRWLLITEKRQKANDILRNTAKTSNIDLSGIDLISIEYEKGGNETNWIIRFKMTVG